MSTFVIIHTSNEEFYKNYLNENNDSGFDIYMPSDGVVKGETFSQKIDLGLKIGMYMESQPIGYLLVPRSSTGSKTKIRMSNSIGVIDSQYRGNLIACVDNFGGDYKYSKGDRLFQIVPFHGNGVNSVIFESLDKTRRGEGGFGSTGL